ncbi:hypothetical protein D7241_02190 [Stutzerimonas sp. VN223-3]|uniref:hypothetical protein n=1 Tax=Stutzerimonas sp. VN223-3 TaxID=3384601 RepID=UPI0038B4B4D1
MTAHPLLPIAYLYSAIAMLTTGVACMAIGLLRGEDRMTPGFIAPGLVLALLAMRRRVC